MMATKKSAFISENILKALAFKEAIEEGEDIKMDDTSFRKGLKKIRKEHLQIAKTFPRNENFFDGRHAA